MKVPKFLWLLFAFAIFSGAIKVMSAEDESAEIVALLPRGMCIIDETVAANYRRLVAMGEKAYPALARELLQTTDATVAGGIIGMFVESKGDKTIPRVAIRRFYQDRTAAFHDQNRVRIMVANSLGDIGERQDAALLQQMLSDPTVPVKVNALRGFAKIGGPESVEFLVNWKTTRSKRQAAALEDAVDAEVDKAISAINRRMSGK